MLTQKQIAILNRIVIGEWDLNPETGLVDINGAVYWNQYSTDIRDFQGIRFGKVTGFFSCLNCYELISLEGSPIYIREYYALDNCYLLRSLEGITQDIKKNLCIRYCKSLHSLKGTGKVDGLIISDGTPLIEGWDDMTQEEQECVINSKEINLL